MTNQEFIEFVIRDKKVPYDDTLLAQIWNYFKIAIQDLETRIDFTYNRKTTILTALKGNNFIVIPDNVKYIVSVYDKNENMNYTAIEILNPFIYCLIRQLQETLTHTF